MFMQSITTWLNELIGIKVDDLNQTLFRNTKQRMEKKAI